MNLNSTLAILICNIKVAIKHHKETNRCKYSKLNVAILTKLVEQGVISSFRVYETSKNIQEIEFRLALIENEAILNDIKMVSKPGQRIYASFKDLKRYLRFFDNILVSTNLGVLNQRECFKTRLGGELLLVYR